MDMTYSVMVSLAPQNPCLCHSISLGTLLHTKEWRELEWRVGEPDAAESAGDSLARASRAEFACSSMMRTAASRGR